MLLEKLFIPVSPFTHYYPLLQLGSSVWRCTSSREEMTQGDLGTEIRDKFHCLGSFSLYLKRSLHSLGSSHRAGRGFPRAVGAAAAKGCLWAGTRRGISGWGQEQLWPQPPETGAPLPVPAVSCVKSNSRGQTCPDLPSSAHPSHCCAEDAGAAWKLGSAERWTDFCYHSKKFL